MAWQSLGAWTLAGCTVAPGFHFGKLEEIALVTPDFANSFKQVIKA